MAGRLLSGLIVRGLTWSSSPYPTLFVDGPLSRASLPAGLGPLSDANLQIVQRLASNSISGAAVNGSIREPLSLGTSPSAKLLEDDTGTFAKLFAPDPGYASTSRWTIDETTLLEAASSPASVRLLGQSAPTVNQILYLGAEALKVASVAAVSGASNAWDVSLTRAQCGSRAQTWALDPSAYPPGDNGAQERLLLTSRPLWDDVAFEASLYQFRMSESDPEAVEAVEWDWNGTLAQRPTFDIQAKQWTVQVTHITQAVRTWSFRAAKDIELASCVIVRQSGEIKKNIGGLGGGLTVSLGLPLKVSFDLTRYEAERLFNFPLHVNTLGWADSTMVSTLKTRLFADSRVTWQIVGDVGGYTWVWRVDDVVFDAIDVITVPATLEAYKPGSACNDNPAVFDPIDGDPGRDDGLNAGFVPLGVGDFVRTAQGETPPKVTLRPRLKMSFPTAAQVLLLSGQGGGVNDASYDILPGGWGMQLDPSWLDLGTSPANPLTVDEGTTHWRELEALLDQVYQYALVAGATLGDWLRNELLLHCCLLGFVHTSGKLAARLWARKKPASPTALNPLVGNANLVTTSERLKALKALIYKRGPDPVTLEPRYTHAVQLPDARAKDVGEAITIVIWLEAGAITDEELETGPFARLERALLGTTLGTPQIWQQPLQISDTTIFGDLPTWSCPYVPTATGLGVTSRGVIVVGVDRRTTDGRNVVRIIEDVVNGAADQSASAGRVAPRLKITAILSNPSSGRYVCVVKSVDADTSFAIDTSHGGIWANMAAAGSRCRLLNPTGHNPTAANERQGMLEASATVNSVVYRTAAHRSEIDFTIAASWQRGGKTFADIVAVGGYIVLQDTVAAAANPEGVLLQGHPNQGFNGGAGRDFAQLARPGNRLPKFDGHKSLVA